MTAEEGYPVKAIYYRTLLYLRNPDMVSDDTNTRFLRIAFYAHIMEFDRMCNGILAGATDHQFNFMFPWHNIEVKGAMEALPSVEDSIAKYEELTGEIIPKG